MLTSKVNLKLKKNIQILCPNTHGRGNNLPKTYAQKICRKKTKICDKKYWDPILFLRLGPVGKFN